jgi:hypothetical protein
MIAPPDILDRHQHRRDEGIPTVSALCGPVGLCVARWRAWTTRRAVPVISLSCPDLSEAVAAWTAGAAASHDLRADAIAWVARLIGAEPRELVSRISAMTRHDAERFWDGLPFASARPTLPAVSRRLLFGPAEGTNLCGAEALSALAELMAPAALPALLFVPRGGDGTDWLARVARLLEELASAAPRLPAAVAAERTLVEGALHAESEPRALALLREGLISVEGLSEPALTGRLRAAGVAPTPAAGILRRLAADGVSVELADSFAATAARVRGAATPDEEDAARSAAERFLFERLESLAETAGLFALNDRLDFRHGRARAEADLYAASLRLVIELDGAHFHLGDRAAYRSDRRKDWEMQRHGYLVLRFLSEDVVERLEEILDTILAAVQLRRGASPERGQTS